MKNKKVKQMLFSVILKGRKAIWQGEETEIFAANSVEQIAEHYGVEVGDTDKHENVISKNWRYWWTPCTSERGSVNGKLITKGKVHKNPNFETLPLICGVYGDENDPIQVLTSYN